MSRPFEWFNLASPSASRSPTERHSRYIAVIHCYLDDSYDEHKVPMVTMASYVSLEDQWKDYELEADALFTERGVDVFHAMEFYKAEKDFDGWTSSQRVKFIEDWFDLAKDRIFMGVSASILKLVHKERQAVTGLSKTQSPYQWCFTTILNWILANDGIKYAIERHGAHVEFMVEAGKSTAGIPKTYEAIKGKYRIEDRLAGIKLVSKKSSRAIQAADAIAYFSRRHAQAMEENSRLPVPTDIYLQAILDRVQHQSVVATDFF